MQASFKIIIWFNFCISGLFTSEVRAQKSHSVDLVSIKQTLVKRLVLAKELVIVQQSKDNYQVLIEVYEYKININF